MPLLTLIPLVLSAIKIALELVAWLEVHPEVGDEFKRVLNRANSALNEAHDAIDLHKPEIPEAP